ncbi:MAG: DUF4105 domain-containing protein [Flavobacteriaceae bacterium]
MRLKHSLILVFLWISFCGFGQPRQLSPNAKISVITCGPGQELYTSFGHNAFRVQDQTQGIDWVYNYGTFNFNAPGFYLNFTLGRPLFSLSVSKFSDFLYSYQFENRWVSEQLLALDQDEKNALFRFLEENRKPENRSYTYDYLYDNCSTKIPEVLKKVLGEQLVIPEDSQGPKPSFRDLIRENLKSNSWSSFGIDLALGAVIDKKINLREQMFIPLKVPAQLDNSSLGNKVLVDRGRTILEATTVSSGFYFTTSPLFWFVLLLVFTMIISYIDVKNDVRSRWLDLFLFLLTGSVGLLIFFLWFITDHSAAALNFNILWAFPLNLVACYYVIRKGKEFPHWFTKYLLGLMVMLGLVILLWIIGIQSFSPILTVLLITLATRYLFLYNYLRKIQPALR